ncbi:MAG: LuxR family transcriptional regulator [Bacteroidetes bacterium]|nr:MAG: LuxR family transcriptional regulator [Bacteroidota bacterium]
MYPLPEMTPTCLLDRSTEIVFQNGALIAFHNGHRYLFHELPEEAQSPFVKEFQQDTDAHRALSAAGIRNPLQQFEYYLKCKYGGFNLTPDCTEDGELEPEHWNCDCGGHCPLHAQLRGRVAVKHGELTAREIEVCVRIASGDTGKAIAADMKISEATLNTHKQHIFKKTGFQSNIEIAKWVTIQNLSHV